MRGLAELAPYEADDPSDYQIEVRIRNARILRRMRRAGIPTVVELCRRVGRPHAMQEIGKLINLQSRPLNEQGKYRPIVEDIATVLGCEPDDLFSEKQRHNSMASNRFFVEVAEVEVEQRLARLESRSAEQIIDEQDFRDGLQKMLDAAGLTPRQRRVLELRFPQDGSPEHSAQEISDMFGVSVSRIGQIEANAFQKLRKMKSAKYVKLWLSRGQRALVEKQASAPEYVCWQEEQNEGS